MKNFFECADYIEFLKQRYDYLKATKPQFSARYLAMKSGINSPSYFKLIISKERRLSLEYAKKLAKGLQLSSLEKQALLYAIELERAQNNSEREKWAKKLENLKKQALSSHNMNKCHIKILSDLLSLKIYLLAQSQHFQFNMKWIQKQLPNDLTVGQIQKRIDELIASNLWTLDENQQVKTMAPIIKTMSSDDQYLVKTHKNIIKASSKALVDQGFDNSIFEGRTFLIEKKSIDQVRERIKNFKEELEAEFESLNSTHTYQFYASFFEI